MPRCQATAKDNTALAETYGHLQRALDAFEHCVVLVDTTQEGGWKVVYTNATISKLTGESSGMHIGSKLVGESLSAPPLVRVTP